LYFRFDYGDGTVTTRTVAAIQQHTYRTTGDYVIRVLVTDQNTTVANLTASGQPSAVWITAVTVLPNTGMLATR